MDVLEEPGVIFKYLDPTLQGWRCENCRRPTDAGVDDGILHTMRYSSEKLRKMVSRKHSHVPFLFLLNQYLQFNELARNSVDENTVNMMKI